MCLCGLKETKPQRTRRKNLCAYVVKNKKQKTKKILTT
jgi:hypothetical protein